MSTKKNYGERREEIRKKMEELKALDRLLQQKQAEEERKQHTRCMIEIGRAVESVLKESLGEEEGKITKEDIPVLTAFLIQQEDRGYYFSKAINTARCKRQAAEAKDVVENADAT